MFVDEIEESIGKSLSYLYDMYGIEVGDEAVGEVPLLLHGDLYSTYDVDFEIPYLVSDIRYIIREEIY